MFFVTILALMAMDDAADAENDKIMKMVVMITMSLTMMSVTIWVLVYIGVSLNSTSTK